ncbi:DUF4145 domain-containing protein [Micromonospora sp. CPCC 205558]|uniref:DUF4145 domain-containing protein n=1 Tax=Micromonospora sp. CPCC 205558 TaxID=3122403 RepID=UPI002FF0D8A8
MSDPTEGMNFRAIHCPFCKNLTLSRVQGIAIEEDNPELVTDALILLHCNTCRKGSLHREIDFGGDGDFFEQVWPQERRALSLSVPEELRAEHQEAVTCFQSGAHTAVVVMVRRTLEGICKLNGVTEKTLFVGLRELQRAGQIDARLMEWAEELRILGNQGAHYTGTKVTREDASDALDLAEAMLDHMYVLTIKFAQFKQRRAAKLERDGVEKQA